MTSKSQFLVATSFPISLAVAACGAGVNSTPAPPTVSTPRPPAPPPPPPAAPTVNTNTVEFESSAGIAHANAQAAYAGGATGEGVTVAVLDSGIASNSTEFAGRISSASQDIASNRGIDDEDGHGTSVAAVIAANRNNNSVVGMAFDATLLVLRTDKPGSCADTGEDGGAPTVSTIWPMPLTSPSGTMRGQSIFRSAAPARAEAFAKP